MADQVRGIAAASVGAGVLLVYAGLTGRSVLGASVALLSGRSPKTAPVTQPITGAAAAAVVAGVNPGGAVIANDALQYQGAGYVWAGAPAKGIGNWDCSSFVNWVLGHDLGLAIPGHPAGTYDGTSHGPNTVAWLAWMGTGVTRIPRAQLAAGDLPCWQTHMGIAISGSQMISAQDPKDGTRVSSVQGPFGEVLFCLRLKAAPGFLSPHPHPGGRVTVP